MIRNAAFEFLRQHKDVEQSTEELVIKKLRGKFSQDELLTIFENGISGQYGKVYSCSADTLMGWINKYESEKNSDQNYITSPLCDVNVPSWESWDWAKETNKCYHAFLNGVSYENFHPCVYDNLMLEGKIPIESYQNYYKFKQDVDYTEQVKEINRAKQRVLLDVFKRYKSYGYSDIFSIRKVA